MAGSNDSNVLNRVENNLEKVGDLVERQYDSTVDYIAKELDNLGLSNHQQIGIIGVFFVISLVLFLASVYMFCWRKRRCCRQEERFTVYRRMVEFEPIIVVQAPDANDKGPKPI